MNYFGGNVKLRMKTCFFVALMCTIWPLTLSAQDVFWQRQVQGYLDGIYMAFYHGGAEYTKRVLADLDGDGDGDLYVGEHDGYLNVFENLGGNPPNWLCLTTALDSIDVGKHNAPAFWDIDLDGDLDLFMGEEDGNIWYYQNTGSPQAPQWSYQTSNYGLIMVDHHAIPFFRDLDADGDDDLLVGHNNGGAALFLNAGSPGSPLWSYQTAYYQNFNVGSKSAAVVFDVNDDNLGDLFMAGQEGRVHYFRNDGPPQNPTYSEMGVIFDVGNNAVPTLWDLDEDGDLDMIIGESEGSLNYLTNIGSPADPIWTFTQLNLGFFDAGFYSKPALADIDGDSDLDLFIGKGHSGIALLENVGSADSAAWNLITTSFESLLLSTQEAPALADLDDDGDQDLLIGSEDGTLNYIQNIGTPSVPDWEEPVPNYAGVDVDYNAAPTVADVDNDGLVDLFIGSYAGTLRYLHNDGTPTSPSWTDLGNYPGIDVGAYSTPAFADLDGDQDLDLLIGNGGLGGFLGFYRNQGNPQLPSWTLETAYYQNWDIGDHSSPCLADMDGDGRTDLFLGCESGGIYYFRNVGLILDVQITLLPYDPPIVIPPEGGSFQYIIRLENNELQSVPILLWAGLTMPNGEIYGPLFSQQLNLAPGVSSQLQSQAIPDTFPSGQYTCTGYVGADSALIYSQYSFALSKSDTTEIVGPGSALPLPRDYRLGPIFPNPFNHTATIHFQLPAASQIELGLYDLSAREVARLWQGWLPAGEHSMQLKADELASGLYFVRLKSEKWTSIQKICHLR